MLTDALRSFKSKLSAAFNKNDRRAKIQDADFIVGLLQAVAKAKGDFSLADLHRSVCLFLGIKVGRSTFNERLATASLVDHLQLALRILMTTFTRKNTATKKMLKKVGVAEIIGVDASLVSLWDGLSEQFKGTFMSAALKLHAAVDLASGTIRWFDVTPGATHDSNCFPDILTRSLYIFDLGYWSRRLLRDIEADGAFFLSRVKSNARLIVTEVVYGTGQSIVGENLLGYQFVRRRKSIIELHVVMYGMPFRVLGFWHKKDKKYRWYLTNLTCARGLIYDLYRLRWQVELSFKAMKSTLNFDRMPTLSPNTVMTLTFSALINYVFATILREEAGTNVIKRKERGKSPSILRATKVFSLCADTILQLARFGQRVTNRAMQRMTEKVLLLLTDVFDPNLKKRKTTIERLLEA